MKLKEKELNVQNQMLDFENNETKRKNLLGKHKKYLIISFFVILCLLIGLSISFSKPGSVTTISEASLKEVLEVSELSTVEYTYNSIVTVSNDKEEMYHVAYQGIVKAGFDFNEIKIADEKKENKVYIDVPDIKINSVNVEEKSLDFIFIKEKYNTETTYQEAYKKSIEDLQQKAENNAELQAMARENAITTIGALIKPWETQLPDGYKVEYR